MTNKITYYCLSFICLSIFITGCEQITVSKFDDASSIYFYRSQYTPNSKGVTQYDSLSYSFFLSGSAIETAIWLQVNLTGNPSPEARKITLRQSNVGEESAAIGGEHYIPFDSERMAQYLVMPANATSTTIPIYLTRTESMEENEFRLVVELVENEDFVTGIKQDYDGQPSFIIRMTAKIAQPATWDRYYDYAFGQWGVEKMKFLIDHVGYTNFEISMNNLDLRYFWNIKAKTILAEYLETNDPLYEENGTLVTFP